MSELKVSPNAAPLGIKPYGSPSTALCNSQPIRLTVYGTPRPQGSASLFSEPVEPPKKMPQCKIHRGYHGFDMECFECVIAKVEAEDRRKMEAGE